MSECHLIIHESIKNDKYYTNSVFKRNVEYDLIHVLHLKYLLLPAIAAIFIISSQQWHPLSLKNSNNK